MAVRLPIRCAPLKGNRLFGDEEAGARESLPDLSRKLYSVHYPIYILFKKTVRLNRIFNKGEKLLGQVRHTETKKIQRSAPENKRRGIA